MKYEEKYYEYLDGLRESGVTNMFGAAPYLEQQFSELTEKEAKDILVDWMKTFGVRERVVARSRKGVSKAGLEEKLAIRFRLDSDAIYEIDADGQEIAHEAPDELIHSFGDELKSLILTEGKTGDVFDIKVVRVKEK